MGTPVLNLTLPDNYTYPPHPTVRLQNDQDVSSSLNKVDSFVGHVTASHFETFFVSGAIAGQLGSGTGSSGPGAGKFYGPLVYAPTDRIITEVVAFQRMSGSGGVTRVNVLTGSKNNTFVSVFSNNALKPAVSAANGDFSVSSTKTFVNTTWPKGYLLGVALDTVCDGPAADLTVHVFWKPSGSGLYG